MTLDAGLWILLVGVAAGAIWFISRRWHRQSSGEKEASILDLVSAAKSVSAATAAGIARQQSFPILPTALAITAGTTMLDYIGVRLRQHQAERGARFLQHCSSLTNIEVVKEIDENPAARDVILKAVRQLQDVDDVAVPALGRLADEYLKNKKPADSFFRGASRLLTELDSTEFASLQTLLTALAAQVRPEELLEIHNMGAPGGGNDVQIIEPHLEGKRPPPLSLGPMGDIPRLFHLLKINDLGRDNPSGFLGVSSGPHVLRITKAFVNRLLALVGAP